MSDRTTLKVIIRFINNRWYATRNYPYVCPYCKRRGRRRISIAIPRESYPLGEANREDSEKLIPYLNLRNEKWLITQRGCEPCQQTYNRLLRHGKPCGIEDVRKQRSLDKWNKKKPPEGYYEFSILNGSDDKIIEKFNMKKGKPYEKSNDSPQQFDKNEYSWSPNRGEAQDDLPF